MCLQSHRHVWYVRMITFLDQMKSFCLSLFAFVAPQVDLNFFSVVFFVCTHVRKVSFKSRLISLPFYFTWNCANLSCRVFEYTTPIKWTVLFDYFCHCYRRPTKVREGNVFSRVCQIVYLRPRLSPPPPTFYILNFVHLGPQCTRTASPPPDKLFSMKRDAGDWHSTEMPSCSQLSLFLFHSRVYPPMSNMNVWVFWRYLLLATIFKINIQ